MLTIMIVAGEPSGDLHASLVAAKIKNLSPDVHLIGMGGDMMEHSGVNLIYHIRDSAVVGIGEVFSSVPAFLKKRRRLKRLIRDRKPDALLLVDFAEFNMNLGRFAHQLGIPVVYYIPPKAWAWRPGRAKKIAKTVSLVAAIFPFEATFYRNEGANVKFVGHPLVDFAKTDLSCNEARQALNLHANLPVLGLMPGSRRQEVSRLLPIMLEVSSQVRESLPGCQIVLPLAPSIRQSSLPKTSFVRYINGNVYETMRAADLMLIASGTATLEAAILGTPMIVIYKMSRSSWQIVRWLSSIEMSGLPNIIAGRKIVPEFLQNDARSSRITPIALDLLQKPQERKVQQDALHWVSAQLGSPGTVERTAQTILDCLQHRSN